MTETGTVKYGDFVRLRNQKGEYLTSISRGVTRRYNWPTLTDESKVNDKRKKVNLQLLHLSDEQGYVESGAILKVATSEPKGGSLNTLGSFIDHNCYYWEDGYDNAKQGWKITKADGTDGTIHYGDEIVITNLAKKQRLAADTRWEGYFTTKENPPDSWLFEKAPSRMRGEHEWIDYYKAFPEILPEAVREDCYPIIREKPEHTKAIVLVHGLTDSPYFMRAIADYFFTELGYNVYLPLLQGHGLLIPNGMEGVTLEKWKENVRYAIKTAAGEGTGDRTGKREVSIGGLSTGGALAFYMAAEPESAITGAVYLFSAALDIAGSSGDVKEILLRTFMADLLDFNAPLIGENPYRYASMDKDGARELSRLIAEIDARLKSYLPQQPLKQPIFAAHSESDTAADIEGIENLIWVSDLDRFRFFRIPKDCKVSHASLVLEAPVERPSERANEKHFYYRWMKAVFDKLEAVLAQLRSKTLQEPVRKSTLDNPVLEKANPLFGKMMAEIAEFDQAIATYSNKNGKFQLEALRDRLQRSEEQDSENPDPTAAETKAIESVIKMHRDILSKTEALTRYATVAQASYGFKKDDKTETGWEPESWEKSSNLLSAVGCKLLDESIVSETWLLDGLQAMCVSVQAADGSSELIVAYRGTNIANPADLIVDGGVAFALCSFTGDNIVRAILSQGKDKTTQSALVKVAERATLVGQIARRLVNAREYYQEKASQLNFEQYEKITIVGHSLGGLIAAHVAYWANEHYQRAVHCHTFNAAPGAKYTLVDSDIKCDHTITNRIINHRMIGDSVSSPPLPGLSLGGTDAEGFPYAHLGYIYNWRPLRKDSLLSSAVHSLEGFITDLHCGTHHLAGISPAPKKGMYW